jgi:hypothetical protein
MSTNESGGNIERRRPATLAERATDRSHITLSETLE